MPVRRRASDETIGRGDGQVCQEVGLALAGVCLCGCRGHPDTWRRSASCGPGIALFIERAPECIGVVARPLIATREGGQRIV